MKETLSREEQFSTAQFEWVKSERSGDVCKFDSFVVEGESEYVNFTDGTRVKTEMIGDIVLLHPQGEPLLGNYLTTGLGPGETPGENVIKRETDILGNVSLLEKTEAINSNPVISIFEKTKKRAEKITLTLTVKLPSPEIYGVIRENFDNVDEILLNDIINQIQRDNILKEALKKELQLKYSLKKKK